MEFFCPFYGIAIGKLHCNMQSHGFQTSQLDRNKNCITLGFQEFQTIEKKRR